MKNRNSESAMMLSHMQVLMQQGEENSLKEGERKVGG